MKFNTLPLPDKLKEPVQVGNVYAARGGPRKDSPKFWIVIALKKESVVLLGVTTEGAVCSSAKYYAYSVERMPLVGFCKDIPSLELKIDLYCV